MKCTGLKAVSYPDTQHLIKGNTVKFGTNTRIFYIVCYSQLMLKQMCKCTFCKTYKKYKWAVVMECKCGCHDEDGMTGHDGLCCEFPNGLRKNNPYKKLKSAEYYRNIITQLERSCDV